MKRLSILYLLNKTKTLSIFIYNQFFKLLLTFFKINKVNIILQLKKSV